MNDRIKAMIELEKRGKLPEQFAPLLAEARNRGLVPPLEKAPAAQDGPPMITKEQAQGAIDARNKQFEGMGTFLNKAGESMTFGLVGDEASAALESLAPGVDYETRRDHYRKNEADFERDHPALALTADVGGAMAAPLGALGHVARAPGMLNKAKQVGASAAATGALSGIYGFAEGEGGAQRRASDALGDAKVGAGIGAALPLVGGAINRAGNALNRGKVDRAAKRAAQGAPSTDDLLAQGARDYQAVDDLGVQIKPQSFDNARGRIVNALRSNTGFDELPGPGSLTPKTARVMQIMDEASGAMRKEPTAALPFRSLDQMRRQAGAAAGNVAEKADQQAGMQVIEGLDDFIGALGPNDVVAGDAKALGPAIEKARKTWATMSKSQKVDDAIEAAENYRYGFANGIKWQFKKILNNPKLARGFDDAEKRAMQRVLNGTIPEKALEIAGSGLTQVGGVVGAGLGAVSGGLPGAVVGLGLTGGSMGARSLANNVSRKNAEIARALIASGKAGQLPVPVESRAGTIAAQLLRQGTAAAVQ